MRMQLKKENNNIDPSIPPVRLGEKEVTHEAATIALRKAIRLNRAIQASDGHWAAENAGPMFFTPPLIIILHISGAINTILTWEHKKELVRYIYLHQNDDGGWGFYIEGHSTMLGSALNYVALRLLGEGPDDGEEWAMTKARQWILDNGSATGIPSWGKTYLLVLGVYEWAGCNPLPPEFWLFPSFLPCHPGEKADIESLYDAVNVLLFLQSPESGGFAIWEPPVPLPAFQMLNPSELFADIMVKTEHVECTASIIHALLTFKRLHPTHWEKKEIKILVAKAIGFLERRQWPNGSWYGYWGICFIYGTFFVLEGLVSAGKTYNNSLVVRRGVEFLLSIQNEEGGWGESLESCPSMKYQPLEGNRTNLVQTSWAMLGLIYGRQAERDTTPLHRAAKLLINA